MTKETRIPKFEVIPDPSNCLDIRLSSFLGHSCFVIHTSILPKSMRANFNVSNSTKLRLYTADEFEYRQPFSRGQRSPWALHGRSASFAIRASRTSARLRGDGRGALWVRA